jgi:hypothetical protein
VCRALGEGDPAGDDHDPQAGERSAGPGLEAPGAVALQAEQGARCYTEKDSSCESEDLETSVVALGWDMAEEDQADGGDDHDRDGEPAAGHVMDAHVSEQHDEQYGHIQN